MAAALGVDASAAVIDAEAEAEAASWAREESVGSDAIVASSSCGRSRAGDCANCRMGGFIRGGVDESERRENVRNDGAVVRRCGL